MQKQIIRQKRMFFTFGICLFFFVSWDLPTTLKNKESLKLTQINIENNNLLRMSENVYNGMASYYHNKFQGEKTANGERYDKKKYTAAIRMNKINVPFGTIIEVRNLQNNKTVQVKVNDKIGNKSASIVDLSYVAAEEIGLIRAGNAKVEVRLITVK